ncbi:TVP38/TMEM64 family protein [Synechococcus sp. PCC 7336]|uniref:TVP38/TMEM64 family protein n=1 Tax=Synechococcus sp. PCC 7336 TaxID=195250 RepID=UPI00034AB58A|nr:TVP38/TMEM64 family protein [Synechococcus sp. PCC 7336]
MQIHNVTAIHKQANRWLWPIGAIALIPIAYLSLHHFPSDILSLSTWRDIADRTGPFGPLLYIAVLAISVIISNIPGLPLLVVAAAIWGPLSASIYTVIGGFLGSMAAYSLGRTLGRSALKTLTGKVFTFSKQRGETFLGWLIFATRLLPIFSFDLISYSAGITGLSAPIYAGATFFGMVPSTMAIAYLGANVTIGWSGGFAYAIAFLAISLGLPWAIRRYNWFDLNEIICIE